MVERFCSSFVIVRSLAAQRTVGARGFGSTDFFIAYVVLDVRVEGGCTGTRLGEVCSES